MNFAFTEEQDELRRQVRRFLDDKSPMTEVRRLMETDEGYDKAVWEQMAGQLGLTALTIPEEYGGAGFGYVELVIVLEEMGALLLCAPYFSTVALAANALLLSNDDTAKKDYLPGIASGETVATFAYVEDSGRWDIDGVILGASGGPGGCSRPQRENMPLSSMTWPGWPLREPRRNRQQGTTQHSMPPSERTPLPSACRRTCALWPGTIR